MDLTDEQLERISKLPKDLATAEMQAAWARTYWLLAETMKAGARDALAMQARAAVA